MKLSEKRFAQNIAEIASEIAKLEQEDPSFSLDPASRLRRACQAQKDFSFFRKTYFQHYITGARPRLKAFQNATASSAAENKRRFKDAELHRWLDKTLPQIVDDPKGQRLAVAAPRGEAKSTVVALCFVLWTVITHRKRHILLISDTMEQAQVLLEAVKRELVNNPRLQNDFPEHFGRGSVWNARVALTVSNVKIQALGAGKRMRGLRHGPYRPDLVVLDDLENDRQVRSPDQRDKLHSWLQKTVLNLGGADGAMDCVYIGTVLHYDSVLARTISRPFWKSRVFQAVVKWPERMDLWDKWETILLERGVDQARSFWNKNRRAMSKGGAVSWPGARDLYQLMSTRAENREAFDAEYQNDPAHGENAPFAECVYFWSEPSEDWIYFGACDPSLGKSGAGRDPSALLIGGFCKATMTLNVVEALIRKRHPDAIIEDIIALHRQYSPVLWGVETIQFQEFFAHVLVQRAEQKGVALPIKPLVNTADKLLRIERLQPHMTQKHILLHPSQHELMRQLRHFPKADHDDGPDALEMLWNIATSGIVGEAVVPLSNAGFSEAVEDSWR